MQLATQRAHSGGTRLALLIPGLQDRLLVHSKAAHVVRHLAERHVRVDVFIDVVVTGGELGPMWVGGSAVAASPEALDLRSIARVFRQAGAHIVDINFTSHVEDVGLPPTKPASWNRFSSYPPFDYSNYWNEVGRNIIRMCKVLERLMHRAVSVAQVEKQAYDYVLFDKDDSEWLGPLSLESLASFQAATAPTHAVYTRDCMQWGGLNDKTFLFTWPAAVAMLSRLFADMYVPDERLNTKSPELFWEALAGSKNVTSVPVPVHVLPTATSTYVKAYGRVELCQKDRYFCSGLFGDGYRASLCGPDLNHPYALLGSIRERLPLVRMGRTVSMHEAWGLRFAPSIGAVALSLPMYRLPKLRGLAPFVLFFGGQSFMNLYIKAVLSSSVVDAASGLHGVPAPFAITAAQQLVGFLACLAVFCLSWCSPWPYRPKPLASWRELSAVAVLSLFFSLNIGLNNLSLSMLDLSENILLRSLGPAVTAAVQLLLAVSMGGLVPRISGGELALYVAGSCSLVLTIWAKASAEGGSGSGPSLVGLGSMVCMSANVASSLELIVVSCLGLRSGLNPVDILFYTAIPSCLLLSVPALLLPHPAWHGYDSMTDLQIVEKVLRVNPHALGLVAPTGLFALLYNALLYKIVQAFSAPHAAFAATANKAVTIFISVCMGLELLPQTHALTVLFVLGIIGTLWTSMQVGLMKAAKAEGT